MVTEEDLKKDTAANGSDFFGWKYPEVDSLSAYAYQEGMGVIFDNEEYRHKSKETPPANVDNSIVNSAITDTQSKQDDDDKKAEKAADVNTSQSVAVKEEQALGGDTLDPELAAKYPSLINIQETLKEAPSIIEFWDKHRPQYTKDMDPGQVSKEGSKRFRELIQDLPAFLSEYNAWRKQVREARDYETRTATGLGTSVTGSELPGSITQQPPIATSESGKAVKKTYAAKYQPIINIITEVATQFGINPDLMVNVAKNESSFNPKIGSGDSTAKGLFQFIDGTWNNLVDRYGKQYGLSYDGVHNPRQNAIACALYMRDHQKAFVAANLPVTDVNLYMGNFLGTDGAVKFLQRFYSGKGGAIAADYLRRESNANPEIFYKNVKRVRVGKRSKVIHKSNPRTFNEVYTLMYRKIT